MGPIKWIWWFMRFVIVLGLTGSLAEFTYRMAVTAADSHMYHQISYSKYNSLLWSKPHR